jgi:hypothetical protein
MNRKHALIAATAVVAAALGLLLAWPESPPDAAAVPAAATGTLVARASAAGPARVTDAVTALPLTLTSQDHDFLKGLRERFAGAMGNKHAQIKAIEQVVAFLMQQYPDDWRGRVLAFLRAAFPELAEALFAKFERLMDFNAWLAEHRAELNALPAAERRVRLWQARRDAFGADADQIWAAQARSEDVRDALVALDGRDELSTEQKLDAYLNAINDTYGADAPRLLVDRQTEVMNSFLALGSVQDSLRAQPAAERNATLRRVRTAVGMDDAALTRWDELDRSRDQVWAAGQRYMSDRAGILSVVALGRQAQQLQQLRVQMFGSEEAAIIQSEEEAGFYRFGGERRIGRE